MSLPKEIRQRIISEALAVNNSTSLMPWKKDPLDREVDKVKVPFGFMEWNTNIASTLFQVNRQFGSEAMECFQMENIPIVIIPYYPREEPRLGSRLRNEFVDGFMRRVIPTKRVSYSYEKESPVPPNALTMDLYFTNSSIMDFYFTEPYPILGSVPNESYERETKLIMMSAQHLPMLIELINSTFSTPLVDNTTVGPGNAFGPPQPDPYKYPLSKIVLNFNEETDIRKLWGIAGSLKGLRLFRFWHEDAVFNTPNGDEFEREIFINGLDPDNTRQLLKFSNLPVLSVEETLEEVKQIIERADEVAEMGHYFSARSNYLLALNTLKQEMVPDRGIVISDIEDISMVLECWRKLARLALKYGRNEEYARFRIITAKATRYLDRISRGNHTRVSSEQVLSRTLLRSYETPRELW